MNYNSRERFIERIGKRIYRNKTTCNCNTCTDVWKNGMIVGDEDHASYLEGCSMEMGIEYFDTPVIDVKDIS